MICSPVIYPESIDNEGLGSLVVDMTLAQLFLDRIEDDPGHFTFQVFDDKGKGTVIPQMLHGSFDMHRDSLAHLNTRQTAGIFVAINRTNLQGRKAENITGIRAFFVDIDDTERTSIQSVLTGPLEPHLIIQSSQLGKGHAYWLVEGAPLETFSAVQTHLINRFHGDPKVKDINRVMRLPGFFHHKSTPIRTMLIHDSGTLPYSYEDVISSFGIDLSSQRKTVQIRGTTNDELLQRLKRTGLYVEPISNRLGGHKILCPWRNEHTTGNSGTAYFEANTSGYSGAAFICHHSHCTHRGIKDLENFFSIPLKSSCFALSEHTTSRGSKPQLYIKGGDLPELLDQAEMALLGGEKLIYQRDGMLVRMLPKRQLTHMLDVRRPEGLVAIEAVPLHYLVEELTREIDWFRPDARGKEGNKWKRSDCPERIAKSGSATLFL